MSDRQWKNGQENPNPVENPDGTGTLISISGERFLGDRTVLVTGGTGFVGKYVIAELLAEGYEVYALTRDVSRDLQGIRMIEGDIAYPIRLPPDVKMIFHCAGVIAEEDHMQAVNVVGTKHIVDAALSSGCRLVHLSSAGVIGPTQQFLVDELSECRPESLYERTKLDAERVVIEGVASGLDANMLRPTTVFGIGRAPEKDSLLHLMRAIKSGKYKNISDGRGIYGIVHAREVARGMLSLSRCDKPKGEAYFINTPVSFSEFAKITSSVVGCANPGSLPFPFAFAATALFSLAESLTGRKMPLSWSRLFALTSKTVYSQARLSDTTDYHPALPIESYIIQVCEEYVKQGLL